MRRARNPSSESSDSARDVRLAHQPAAICAGTETSAAEAEADALRRCGSRGETNCRVMITYQDQCAVIVEPHINGKPFSTGIVKFVSTGSIAKASELGKSDCKQENSATPEAHCVVVHAACSYPVFREY